MALNTRRLNVLTAWLLAVALAEPGVAAAVTLNVTDLGDSGAPGQLRRLINAAAPGDTIVIPAGIIVLKGGGLGITTNLTIQGIGMSATIIDGGGNDRVASVCGQTVTVTISGLTIRNGSTNGRGGGIVNCSGNTLTLTDVTFSGNRASAGGGVTNEGGAATLINVTFSGNTAAFGGGIANFGTGATLTLRNVTIRGNTAIEDGGGVFNNSGTITLTSGTLSGNTANGDGGGIAHVGTATLTNVTISDNTANEFGGGIFSFNAALGLTNVTLADNTAASGGDIFNGALSSIQFKNTILANSPSGGNCSGSGISSLGHNLDSGTSCHFMQPGDLNNTDPKLGPLQNNGGLTLTHALLPGSPAIDAGTNTGCPATDQRGVARPQGAACDIGAYEAVPFDPAAASAFVTRLYQTVLGRAPDPGGLAAFIAQIQAFGTVIPTVLAFFHSPEFLSRNTSNEQFLTICYHTFLDRDPDPTGFNAFLADLQSGLRTRDNLLDIFLDSQEFAALASFLPPQDPVTAFVTTLYVRILGRGPDLQGLQTFVAQLHQTRTVLPTVLAFLHSPEFLTRNTSNTEYVTVLYRVFLDRVPDAAGLAGWVALLTQGSATRDQLAAQFAASAEFQAIQHQLFP